MDRLKRAKTARGRRHLKRLLPQAYEHQRTIGIIRSTKASTKVLEVQKSIVGIAELDGQNVTNKNQRFLIGENVVNFSRSRKIHPFEDASDLEDLAQKTPCSIFIFASHSKKRQDNLVFARMYDGQVLDLLELGVDLFIPIEGFKNEKSKFGQPPLILFTGSEFSCSEEMKCLKDMMLDVFHKDPQIDLYDLKGIDHIMTFTALGNNQVDIRTYLVDLKKSQSKFPRVELTEIGPRIGAQIRRVKFANRSVLKVASIVSEFNKKPKVKNVSSSSVGDKVGKVYPQPQDLYSLQTRKTKALKRQRDVNIAEDSASSPEPQALL